MPIKKNCVTCGKEFQVPPCRELTAKTCSHECAISVRAKSRERKIVVTCKNCGEEFKIPQSHKSRRVYCSKGCKHGSETYRSDISDRFTGDKNPMWKGGETEHSDGYIYKLAPEHPFASNGYVFKHRLIMEKWLREENPTSKFLKLVDGKLYLSPKANVHHLDWNRKHNFRKNLLVSSNSVHIKIHRGTYPEPGEYWPHSAKIKLGSIIKKELPGF